MTGRDAEHNDIGGLPAVGAGAVQIGSKHAHVALVAKQVGYNGAKRFVVAGHMYHYHDNSLSLTNPFNARTKLYRRPTSGCGRNKSMSSRRLLLRAPATRSCDASCQSSSIDHCE
jgi:hypothetical protein